MDNIAELPKPPNTFIIILKDTYKFGKFVLLASVIFVSVDIAKQLYSETQRRFLAAKESFISSQVVNSLNTKTIAFDEQKRIAKPVSEMSRDELLRALYVVEMERRGAEQVISFVSQTVNYGREGDSREVLNATHREH